MVEAVVWNDDVVRAAIGDSGGVKAEAREGDFEDRGGTEGLIVWGVGGEVVSGEEVAEVFDFEEVLDGGDSGGVWKPVVDEGVAVGGGGGGVGTSET